MKRKDKATAQATLSARINAGSDALRASIAKPDNGAPVDADNGAPVDADNGAPADADNGADSEWQMSGCRIRKGGSDKRKAQFREAGAESAILSATIETAQERGWLPEGTLREQVHAGGALVALRIRTAPDTLKRCRDRFTESAKAIAGTSEDEVRERKALEHGALALARWQTAAYDSALNGGISKGAIKSVSAVIFASSVSVSASCKGID